MKEQVKVAVIQMDIAWLRPEENLKKMIRFIEEACNTGGRI